MIFCLLLVLIVAIATLFWSPLDSSWISAIIALAALLVSFSKDYKSGYERGADDSWMFDKGANDKNYGGGPDSELKDNQDYNNGYNSQ